MSINSVDELWNRIYDDCRQNERITDVGLKTWIIDLKPTFNEDGSLTLITNNEYKKKTIDSYYKDILEASCEAVSGLPNFTPLSSASFIPSACRERIFRRSF